MSLEGFTAFLLSPDNAPFADPPGQIVQDMTRPLSEYYISSSHNTYLIGNQLTGETTVEGYIRALLHSCRSVERSFLPSLLIYLDLDPLAFQSTYTTARRSQACTTARR
jgi:hypothetical protein